MIVDSFQLGPLLIGTLEAANERYSDEFFLSKLSASEIELSKRFKHPLRKREFLAGRAILHSLEPHLPPVLCAESGMPIWDTAFTGSISHKNGWVLACVDSTQNFRSIGIDVEEPAKFPLDVANVICVPDELQMLAQVDSPGDLLALIFSCKESLFKCCYPICKIWFGFQDAKLLSYDFSSGTFRIELLKDLAPEFLSGRTFDGLFKEELLSGRRFVLTSLVLSHL